MNTNNIKKNSLTVIILLFFTTLTFAKTGDGFKFGKFSPEEISLDKYNLDSTAGAVILYNFGEIKFIYNDTKSAFEIEMTRKVRIKILDKSELEQANIQLILYKNGKDEESISKLKASTWNVVNNKPTETELQKSAIFKKEIDQKHNSVSFAFPNVKVGSIIEYEYTLSSPFIYELPTWYFQHEIPVKTSHFTINTPEFFNYRASVKGYLQLPAALRDTRKESANFMVTTNTEIQRSSTGMSTSTGNNTTTGTFEFQVFENTWIMENIPSIIEEPYITTMDNYTSQINHELVSIQYPNSTPKYFSNSWQSCIKELLEEEKLGMQITRPSEYLNDILAEMNNEPYPLNKIKIAYNSIRNKMKWNGAKSIFSSYTIRDAYKNGLGNIADINLNLYKLLINANIKADIIFLSTRENGFLPEFPNISGFNYLIVSAESNGQKYFLDASDRNLNVGELPLRCLNGSGLYLHENKADWVEITTNQSHNNTTFIDAKLDANGKISGKLNYNKKNYAAYMLRKELTDLNDVEQFYAKKIKENPGLKLITKSLQNIDSAHLPVKMAFDFELENATIANNNLLFITPEMIDKSDENPFKTANRQFPVDFAYTIDEAYILNLKLPDGYKVEEKPENFTLKLPNNDASFSYTLNIQNENLVQLNYKLSIKKTLFVPSEYEALREFYTILLKKLDEQIVLKKI